MAAPTRIDPLPAACRAGPPRRQIRTLSPTGCQRDFQRKTNSFRTKISTQLAAIYDAGLRVNGQTVADIKDIMARLGQIRNGSELYVYVHVNPAHSLTEVTSSMVEVVNEDEAWKLVAGWVEETELETLAAKDAVDLIYCVDPPRYRQQGGTDTQGTTTLNDYDLYLYDYNNLAAGPIAQSVSPIN